jgi:hypothetical protein
MIALPPYSRWREIASLPSILLNILWLRGTAWRSTSANLYLTQHPKAHAVDAFFRSVADEDHHCKTAAIEAGVRARETLDLVEARGLTRTVERVYQAERGGR